ncbi:TetR/AcrR family transcriptional regulator [Galbitalea soli]|uniref:TetR/AcrR family transcriptional regulator n=1 Tax=Galbitalea soli TaxID=1268042 RepID=UPI00181EF804|nr:AcrR family transcriptional regulator [Galbitalea soli]
MTVVVNDVDLEPTAQRAPGAKQRILETADRLFYGDGIRSVGIDRLISESSVTKATFYKHYGSKDRLILLYIEGRHTAEVADLEAILAAHPAPEAALRAIVAAIVADIATPGFRGCAFLNAATEFADARHPVRSVVLRHREWYTGFLADLLQDLGHRMPGDAADEFMLARDGAMTGGYAGDPIAASAALQRVTDAVIATAQLAH